MRRNAIWGFVLACGGGGGGAGRFTGGVAIVTRILVGFIFMAVAGASVGGGALGGGSAGGHKRPREGCFFFMIEFS